MLKIMQSFRLAFFTFAGLLFFAFSPVFMAQASETPQNFEQLLKHFSGMEDRATGSPGAAQSAQFIQSYFTSLGYNKVGAQTFLMPARLKTNTHIRIGSNGQPFDLSPFLSNAISPDTLADPGLTGHLVYVGKGEMAQFNHKKIKDAIVLMDLDSSANWLNALSLGARAIIYIYKPPVDKFLLEDKFELSPVKFPRFVLPLKKALQIFPDFNKNELTGNRPEKTVHATITSDLKWTHTLAQNIYCMIPGTDEALEDEVIIIEGFYDTRGFIPGKSPGADQACSIATLLDLALHLKTHPPKRSILLVATPGQANALAGMREMMWSIDTKSRVLKKQLSHHKKNLAQFKDSLDALKKYIPGQTMEQEVLDRIQANINETIKTRIDTQSNQLMQLRLEKDRDEHTIKTIATQRMALKRLESKNNFSALSAEEITLVESLIAPTIQALEKTIDNEATHKENITSSLAFKKLFRSKQIQNIISLHLSSNGNGIGAFNEGWLYEVKDTVNGFAPYVELNDVLLANAKKTGEKMGVAGFFKDTLRPSLQRSWESYFKDTPMLGGEVSRLAGFLGLTLVSTNDARRFWNTPYDTIEKVNIKKAVQQSRFIADLISGLAAEPDIKPGRLPRNGFATLWARANFLRHGAVFADAPAPQSVILSFQGPGVFYNIVDESGNFVLKGVSTKKLTLHKVILEGYKFDPVTGETIWAVDKKKTTKARYRVKVTKRRMETDLVMFPCAQTTIVNLLEPRTFNYMTKMQVFDARMDATPVRHWYSRIDTRSSLISSIYLQPGTRLKIALSDTLLTKKLILTHADDEHSAGNGYRIDDTPVIAPTQYYAAKDMWALLNPRINNLDEKGINNQKIRDLQSFGNQALENARQHYENQIYDRFFSASGNALAFAGRVYDHVESIQKDVLYGVLFYIVLFAPFAFCMERLVFAFINIYKRIAGFTGILLTLIAIIYNVHPAFDLAYSPIVVILAFFIIGLSAIVTWIIFHHFENEMKSLHQQGKRGNEGEISLFKAFSASFFMGVNNLRRRRVRTALTCTTLIILTFTIMSFTSVKSIRQHSKLLYNSQSPYQGLLVKQINWKTLPERAYKIIENTMSEDTITAPRVWLETKQRVQTTKIPLVFNGKQAEANGLLGLSPEEAQVTTLPGMVSKGRWFSEQDRYSIIIPEGMAKSLNISSIESRDHYIHLWSIPFKVIGIFSGQTFDTFKDLDGEPISPAIFPDEIFQQTTEAEMDAMESGDDVKSFQSRYKHIPFGQTVIIPYKTLLSLGGNLKSVAMKYKQLTEDHSLTFKMVDRFGLWLFSGEKKGVFLYSASDSLNYSGLPNVMIPILISIFIVLNTMIGSVQERKREIGIYTSIGMAPSHVSIIFIAEALSYAVISVVLGYIMAQVLVKVLAGTPLMAGLTVNYSSLGGVFAMAMVMLVVLLSSIYPSKIAASIAIPDVEKSWELGKAEGNILNIELPFLIKNIEDLSVCGFLYDLFDTHRAVSHGIFSVGRLGITRGEDKNFTIRFTAWLAPFDLGVMQDVQFHVNPSSHFKGYMDIGMKIERKSGEHNTWWRVNKRFVNLIRKQLLIWRSMDHAQKETFKTLMESQLEKEGNPID